MRTGKRGERDVERERKTRRGGGMRERKRVAVILFEAISCRLFCTVFFFFCYRYKAPLSLFFVKNNR